jgi:glycosyltransferase involved in cell wall biosynthesis
VTPPLLFVTGEYPPDVGGVGDYTAHLRSALEGLGWRSEVLTRRQVRRWDARSLIALARATPRQGIVHIEYQAGAFDLLGDVCLMPSLLRAANSSVRVVTTFHDVRVPYLFPKAGALRAAAVRLLARTSDAVVAASAADLRVLGGPTGRHYQVPIGSNLACDPPPGYLRSAFRAALGLTEDALLVAYFGLLNASKGLPLLLHTFERVVAVRPDARLLLLGGGVGASDPTDRQTAAGLRQSLAALGDRVIRTGWLEPAKVSAHLLAADIALLPYADGASARRGSLLACATHGLPIVSTAPAAPEVASAIEVSQPSAEALANAVLGLAVDSARRDGFASAARALADAVAWPRIAADHVAIYNRLLYS